MSLISIIDLRPDTTNKIYNFMIEVDHLTRIIQLRKYRWFTKYIIENHNNECLR